MVNDCIRIGLDSDATSLKRLSIIAYHTLSQKYSSAPSYYRLTAISKAAGILASRAKSLRRDVPTKDPFLKKPLLVSCYAFQAKNGFLCFPVGKSSKKVRIPLTGHTMQEISKEGIEVRSFTLTESSLSPTFRKEIDPYIPSSFLGIDRNASNVSNVTLGNRKDAVQFDLRKVEEIARTTRRIVKSFKRNDVRIRTKLASKYGKRRSEKSRADSPPYDKGNSFTGRSK